MIFLLLYINSTTISCCMYAAVASWGSLMIVQLAITFLANPKESPASWDHWESSVSEHQDYCRDGCCVCLERDFVVWWKAFISTPVLLSSYLHDSHKRWIYFTVAIWNMTALEMDVRQAKLATSLHFLL